MHLLRPGARLRQTSLTSRAMGGASAPPVPPSLLFLIAGQSNGVGSDTRVLTTTPSARHKRFTPGVRTQGGGLSPLIGLYEQADSFGGSGGETLASSFAGHLDTLTSESDRVLMACHALSGGFLTQINKGTTPYSYGLAQMTAAVAASPDIEVGGVLFVHGESDTQSNSLTYPANLTTLQGDYDTDSKAATGQAAEVVMYCLQNPAYPPGSTSATGTNKNGSCQLTYLSRAVSNPSEFVCVGPAYWFQWLTDGLHYRAEYQRVLGAMMAKFVKRKRAAETSLPLYPTAAVRTGTSVVVTFHVPVSPIVWRMDLYQNTTSGNTNQVHGFGFYDDSGTPPAVTAVSITATNQVTLTLASVPTGTQGSQEIRIAHSTSQSSGNGGCPLADSDTDVDEFGTPLPNFCCHSFIAVTV